MGPFNIKHAFLDVTMQSHNYTYIAISILLSCLDKKAHLWHSINGQQPLILPSFDKIHKN